MQNGFGMPNGGGQGGFSQQGFPQQGFPQQGFPQQGFPQQGFPQQGFPQQPNQQNGFQGSQPPGGLQQQGGQINTNNGQGNSAIYNPGMRNGAMGLSFYKLIVLIGLVASLY